MEQNGRLVFCQLQGLLYSPSCNLSKFDLLGPEIMATCKKKPINWLKLTDAIAVTLPRARSWINYPYFFFVRYPHLQPADSADRKHQLHLEVCRETVQEELHKWESRIEKDENARQVLKGLNRGHRAQLAALMIDCDADLGDYFARLEYHKRLRKAAFGAAGNERVLKSKLVAVHEALYKLINLPSFSAITDDHIANRKVEACRRAYVRLESYLAKLSPLLKPIHLFGNVLPEPESIRFPDLVGLLNTPGFHVIPTYPVAPCMIKLYWFFRHGCEITGDQSEVRVALLRNTFWKKYKIPLVKYREKFDREAAEPAGCPAVIEAVRRYSAKITSK